MANEYFLVIPCHNKRMSPSEILEKQPIKRGLGQLKNNICDVALIFEGGGMRNSYSSGAVNVLLENEIFFNNVYGLSAGATNAINYVSRDLKRSEASFADYTADFSFRKFFSLFLDSEKPSDAEAHVYAKNENSSQFDFNSFRENPALLTLQTVDRDTGETVYFTNRDFTSAEALMSRVHASTSFPIIMPPVKIGERFCYDGGIGDGGGIMLPRAQADGFRRYFVVCTHGRGFRKLGKRRRMYDAFFWHRPQMRKVMDTWNQRYNAQMDKLEQLEAEGRAYVFYATEQSVKNTERDAVKLKENYRKGHEQAERELPAWIEFLGL